MATRFSFPSATNGFIAEPTGQVIQFIRNESEFPLNRYVRYIPSPKTVGLYAVVGRDQMVRVVADSQFAWYDGDERPRGDSNKNAFETVEFATFRRDYPWTLGYLTIEQATVWKPKLTHMGNSISVAMTNRTNRVASLLQTSANWPASQVATMNTLNGGAGGIATASDDPSSPNYLAIYKTFMEMARRINLATNAKVKPKDMRVVLGVGNAIKMGESSELTNYMRESPYSREVLEEGLDPDVNALWGLPRRYKSFELVVEDSPIVTEFNTFSGASISSAGALVEATTNRNYIFSDSSFVMLTRPGGIDGEYGSPSFETVQLYHYGGLLEVFLYDDYRNKRVDGHVEENIAQVIAAPYSGYMATGV